MAVALAMLGAPEAGSGSARHGAAKEPLAVPSLRLFDLGVADVDHDSRLDVFSAAHNFPGAALLNDGAGGFHAAPAALGFGQLLGFPGFEETMVPPVKTVPGVYVFVKLRSREAADSDLTLDAYELPAHVDIRLDPIRNAQIQLMTGATSTLEHQGSVDVLHIEFEPGGHAEIKLPLDLPISVDSPQPTFVGANAVRAPQTRFDLRLPDVHADVFADLDGDGSDDLFRVVGGLAGNIVDPRFRGRVNDVPRLWDGTGYRDVDLGLGKDVCRGRQAAVLDANADGYADIFETCATAKTGAPGYPVIAYGSETGAFRSEIVPAAGAVYRWLNSGPSALPKLLVLGDVSASLWQRGPGDWQQLDSVALPGGPGQTALGDPDRNGNPDIYVSGERHAALLSVTGPHIRRSRPPARGLPSHSSAAAWVDSDNDGRLDLHSVPSGLYTGNRGGRRFEAADLLHEPNRYAQLTWADFDADGFREPIVGLSDRQFAMTNRVYWRGTEPFERRSSRQWLELDLPGAWLTSEVTITPDRGETQTAWAGESETSRFSQGHSRLYFTFPPDARRAKVSIRTPDGEVRALGTRLERVIRVPPDAG